MIKLDGKEVALVQFPDGTFSSKIEVPVDQNGKAKETAEITWFFKDNSELVALMFLVRHLKDAGVLNIDLYMPYIPNARMDRVKAPEDVFTLKYFAGMINWLGFRTVRVLDPHSYVSEALIDRVCIDTPEELISQALHKIENQEILMFYPDEGAMKRYSGKFQNPYAFGIKRRDWKTGTILGLDVAGETETIAGSDILIIDDICSRGGTFYHSAKKLKELGAGKIYLYISHCENSILQGEVLTSGLIERVYTTNSIFTEKHEKVEVFEL